MIVVDYTSRIPPSALKEAGVVGVCRYLSWLPNPKVIRKPEYDELTAAGIVITLNWEYDARDWMRPQQARSHAIEACAQARLLGYPGGSVIVGSCDFDMTNAEWVTVGYAYAKTFAQQIRASGYRPGVYGPWNVLSWVHGAGLMDAFWQAGMSTAWSNGLNRNPWPGAHLRQRAHKTIAGHDTDWNEIRIPAWGVKEETETQMPFLAHDGETDKFYVCDLITSREVHPDDVPHVLGLAKQLNYNHVVTFNPVEWSHDGWVREGWTEGRFGTLQSRFILPENLPTSTPATGPSTVEVSGTLTLTPTEPA